MNKKQLQQLAVVVCLALAINLGLILHACNKSQPMQTSGAPTPPQGNLAASRDFLVEWAEFQDLQAQIKAKEKETNIRALYDRLNGMATRLQGQVPQGFVWDAATKSFAPQPRPAPQPTQNNTNPTNQVQPAPIPKKP